MIGIREICQLLLKLHYRLSTTLFHYLVFFCLYSLNFPNLNNKYSQRERFSILNARLE